MYSEYVNLNKFEVAAIVSDYQMVIAIVVALAAIAILGIWSFFDDRMNKKIKEAGEAAEAKLAAISKAKDELIAEYRSSSARCKNCLTSQAQPDATKRKCTHSPGNGPIMEAEDVCGKWQESI